MAACHWPYAQAKQCLVQSPHLYTCRLLPAQLSKSFCMQAFSSMRWYAQYSRGKKAMLGSTLKRFSQRLLAAAFAGMREECSQKRQLRVMAMQAVAYWKGSATVAAFSAWSDWTTERLQTKRKVHRQTPSEEKLLTSGWDQESLKRKVKGGYARAAANCHHLICGRLEAV